MLNEEIRDDYIEHEVRLRRVAADIGRKVDKELIRLGQEIGGLAIQHDPNAVKSDRFKERRGNVLMKKGKETIAVRMSEILAMVNKELGTLSIAEASFAEDVLRKRLNG